MNYFCRGVRSQRIGIGSTGVAAGSGVDRSVHQPVFQCRPSRLVRDKVSYSAPAPGGEIGREADPGVGYTTYMRLLQDIGLASRQLRLLIAGHCPCAGCNVLC
jgi:hypothetical protein